MKHRIYDRVLKLLPRRERLWIETKKGPGPVGKLIKFIASPLLNSENDLLLDFGYTLSLKGILK